MPIDIDVIENRISDIKKTIQELHRLTTKQYEKLSMDEKYSIRYNVIVLVEALVALCSHISIEDLDKTPQSYKESVRIVAEHFSLPCTEDLEALVGLRNLLIHRYHVILDRKIYFFIKEDFECLYKLIEEVEKKYL
ncbi:MAG: DUF86 domain-containing protein [Thermoproteales archaeon]|nr:DUF86 domain-containing protein [Thermoproteales archaeon]